MIKNTLVETSFDALAADGALGGRKSSVTIGNFDGCHRGHQSLVKNACDIGHLLEADATVVTFTPHPDCFFRGDQATALLFTAEQKRRAFKELGLDRLVIQTFDEAFAKVGHQEFYDDHLRRRLGLVALTVGANFRFGKGRGGDTEYLLARSAADGVKITIDSGVMFAGEPISSSRLRLLLAEGGDAASAAVMLGRPYLLEGIIERGDQLGRTLGVPTANLEQVRQLVPRFGVYAGYVWLAPEGGPTDARPTILARDARAVRAVFGIGVRPSIKSAAKAALRIEAHLLDGTYGENALYGCRAGFYLTDWLRGEETFPSLDALTVQMRADIVRARTLLR